MAGLATYDAMDGEIHNPIRGLGVTLSGPLMIIGLSGIALFLVGAVSYSEDDGRLDWDKKAYWSMLAGVAIVFIAGLAAKFT